MITAQDIVDTVPGAIFRFIRRRDGSKCFTFLSRGTEALFEMSREMLLRDFSASMSGYSQPEIDHFAQRVDESARTLTSFDWEGQLRFAAGRTKWIQVIAKPFSQPTGDTLWDGMMLDITDRKKEERTLKKASDELHAQKSLLKNILACIPYSVFWKDSNCVYLGCNEQFAKDAGIPSPEFLVGKTDFEMPWKREEAEFFRKCDFEIMARGEPLLNIEEPISVAGGKQLILMTSKVPMKDQTATVTGILGIYTDVTEFREAQIKASENQAKLIAASKMSALGEMAAGMAHEINNPVAIIQTLVGQVYDLFGEEPCDKAQIRKMLGDVNTTVDRIASIVHGLKSFTRDGTDDRFEKVAFRAILDDTLTFCAERFKGHSVAIKYENIDDGVSLNCRSVQISQVVLNLLNNAFDAVAGLPEKWVEVAAHRKAGSVEIAITDSGKGIAPELHQKIFQPFFTTKDVGKGTGLGLSVSRGILEAHGGELTYDETSVHTRFVLRLPSVDGLAEISPSNLPPKSPEKKK